MKIRTGFVSNSSSSSFILAVDDASKKITIELDITTCVSNVIKTLEQLDEHFVDMYGWSEAPTIQALIEADDEDLKYGKYFEAKAAIEAGKTILIGSGSSEGDCAADFAIYNGAIEDLNQDGVDVLLSEH